VGWPNRPCPLVQLVRTRTRGHHVVGAGGGAAAGDEGGGPMGIGHRIELGEGTGLASDMERRVVAYPSGDSMAWQRVWLGVALQDGEQRRRRQGARRRGRRASLGPATA
jgi:hypothetical protein